MSSLGSQWRVIRHYLSLSNLNAEVEKLVQKLKPATSEQWDQLMSKIENSIVTRLKETEESKNSNILKASTTVSEETKTVQKEKNDKVEEKAPAQDSQPESAEITFKSIMQGLKLKKDLHFGKISETSWKANKPSMSKSSIQSRTAHVVSALASAETEESRRRRVLHLLDHLHQYPEATHYAVKQGAVRALLRTESRAGFTPLGDEIRALVREALALTWTSQPPGARGPRILSLDGGGVRGLVALALLRELELAAGRPVHELFDFVIGVSTGAIIAAFIGARKGTLDEACEMYRSLSKQMFGSTWALGGAGRLVWSHGYYDTAGWERLLRAALGDLTLSQCSRQPGPKLALVSCAVSAGGAAPFVFRSYAAGGGSGGLGGVARAPGGVGAGGHGEVAGGSGPALLWHGVRASAAAPAYFAEFPLHGRLHHDGGIMANNPTGIGIHEAKLLYGESVLRDGTVVSLGSGRPPRVRVPPPSATSWRDKFNHILDSATDTEGVHQVLNDILPPSVYYRLNPPLVQAVSMDDTDEARLAGLARDAAEYARRNRPRLRDLARRLLRPRTLAQKARDSATRHAIMMGLVDS